MTKAPSTQVHDELKRELADAIGTEPTAQDVAALGHGLHGHRWARPAFQQYGAGVESARRWDAAYAIGEQNACRYAQAIVDDHR